MTIRNRIFGRFQASERGSLSVEAVLAFPFLIWALIATFVFWDAYKTQNISQKATYTIADLLSRETAGVDSDYMTSVHELYGYLSQNYSESAVRVTVVSLEEDPMTGAKTLQLEWSEAVGGNIQGYTQLGAFVNRIPTMAPGNQLILVETYQSWAPVFSFVGLDPMVFDASAVVRPRYAPQLKWDPPSA